MAIGDIIKCKALLERKPRFYNEDGGFGIVQLKLLEDKTGNVITDKFKNFILKGEMPEPVIDTEYFVTAEETEDPKWGVQYKCKSMSAAITIAVGDKDGQRKFLEHLFTETQVENMYKALDDPFGAFEKKDTSALVKIKGCGFNTVVKWVKKFEDNLYLAKVFRELEDYNLTNSMVTKLLKSYESPDLVVQKVKNNPYILCDEVDGIGWLSADKIAQNGGMGKHDPKRIASFISYYLKERSESGYSYITTDELMGALLNTLGEDLPDEPIGIAINSMKQLWWSEDKEYIGLKKFKILADNIAKNLLRIRDSENNFKSDNWREIVKKVEEEQGWTFTDEQLNGIQAVLENQVVLITGLAGCVDCDTEFFTGTGWKKISEYKQGDKVLQYNEDGTATLVEPWNYVKQPKEKLWHFETKYGLDQCLSDDHDVVYLSSKNNIVHRPFHEVKKMQERDGLGFLGRFITSYDYSGEGIDLSDDYIRLMVAVFGDGSYYNNAKEHNDSYLICRMHLKKDRKKKRITEILERLNLNYRTHESAEAGYIDYYFKTPFRAKNFPKEWYNCNKHQLAVIADEVMFWDGNYGEHNRYTTTNKEDADFVQFVYTSFGYRTTIKTCDRRGRIRNINGKDYITNSVDYYVTYTDRSNVAMCYDNRPDHTKTKIKEYKTKDGHMYCFEVPSHMLVLRRNNKIFVTGNCGKTTIIKAVLEALSSEYNSCFCALSGRAAARITEVTGRDGYTIHRLLGFPQGDAEHQNYAFYEGNPLPHDIIIVDEISMVDAYLFNSLIRAVRDGAKLIMLGDVGQLESIGCGNIAYDILNSPEIKTVELTKIHRQAAASGIITESRKVYDGIQLSSKDAVTHEVRGELQDLELDLYSDKSNTFYKTVQYFQKYITQVNNIMDLQIIVPVKNRGDACCFNINNAIQELYNPVNDDKKELTVYYSKDTVGVLRVGDKVINTKNNYSINTYRECTTQDEQIAAEFDVNPHEGTKTAIFNGFMGIITDIDIDNKTLVIDFFDVGKVIIPRTFINNIELAYACTGHKMQGSQAQIVIVGLDWSSYSLLSKEWVYTALTRAQKHCVLVAQNSALAYAINKKGVSEKLTHLQNSLYEMAHPKLDF